MPGQAQGISYHPGPQTGDLVIDLPDGRRIVTEHGDGWRRLNYEIQAAKSKFDATDSSGGK